MVRAVDFGAIIQITKRLPSLKETAADETLTSVDESRGILTNFIEIIHTSYATLLSGISRNNPRVTCIFLYTHEPLGKCVYSCFEKGCLTIGEKFTRRCRKSL